MNWKLFVKYSSVSALLVAFALCLLLPLQNINAGSSEPTPSPTMNIITRLQPGRTANAEPNQFDGRLIEQAPSPSEVEKSPASTVDQQTFNAIADAKVLEGYPTVNFGDTTDMWAGYDEYLDPHGQIARSLVKFDIASLPPDQTITKATLRVYLVSSRDYPDTSRTIMTYGITSDWSEGNVNWNNMPDYGSAYGSMSIVYSAWDWYEFDVSELVTAWYTGAHSNNGIMLRGPETSGVDSSWRGFDTRESSYTPQLVIDFTVYTPTPTPTTTPTSTLTSTPTPTSTPGGPPPLNKFVYLPLVMRSYLPGPTPTPTAIPTPGSETPKPTNTPTVTDTLSPMNTPTPTLTETPEPTPETPIPCPQTGKWFGVTDQDEQIVFDVTNETECLIESLRINVRLVCTDVVFVTSIYFDETYQISNGHFKAVDPWATVIGNFNTSTSSSGTWNSSFNHPEYGFCSGSGTWTAAR